MADGSPSSSSPWLIVGKSLLLIAWPARFTSLTFSTPTARSGRQCSCAAAPTWLAPGGCCKAFADLLKFVLKEPIIPAGANKGVFLLAPLVTGHPGALGLGRGPGQRGWAIADHQCRHSLHLRRVLAGRLRRHHGRLGLQFEISVSVALRSAAQMVSYEVSIGFVIITVLLVRGLAQPDEDRQGAGQPLRPAGLVLAAAVPDVRDLLHLGAGGDQPPAV
jgi:NADH-quinone oxidoreductase subunit H